MLDDHHDQPPLARGVNGGLAFLNGNDHLLRHFFYGGEFDTLRFKVRRHGRIGGTGFDQHELDARASHAVLQTLEHPVRILEMVFQKATLF